MLSNYSTYIFDFDGTLVDSMPIWIEKMFLILRKEGIECTDQLIKKITPLGDMGVAQYFKNTLGVKMSIGEMLNMMDDFALPHYEKNIVLKNGVYKYLVYLKKKGCSLNILSASPHKMIDVCLKNNGIFEMFDNVWCSGDFNMAKSNPCIYKKISAELNTSTENIVMFDDNPEAISASTKAGLYTVGVYDKSSIAFSTEIKQIANLYIKTFQDLI